MAMFASGQIFAYSRPTPFLFDSILKEDKNIAISSVCPKEVYPRFERERNIFIEESLSLSLLFDVNIFFTCLKAKR